MAKMGGSARLGRGMALSPMEGSSQRIPDIGRSAAYADSFKDSARYRPPMASLSESAIWPHRTEAATRPHCGRQSGKKGLMRTVLARFARICRAYTSSQWFCNIFFIQRDRANGVLSHVQSCRATMASSRSFRSIGTRMSSYHDVMETHQTTTQQRATGTERGTDTKPTLEVAGVPS